MIDFLFHIHFMLLILGHANTLFQDLHKKDEGILEAMVEVKFTKKKFQKIRDDGWESLVLRSYTFCEDHGILKLDMEEEYIDRHMPRKNTICTNYEYYRYDCLNPIIDLLLREFSGRFNEVNLDLLTHMAAF